MKTYVINENAARTGWAKLGLNQGRRDLCPADLARSGCIDAPDNIPTGSTSARVQYHEGRATFVYVWGEQLRAGCLS